MKLDIDRIIAMVTKKKEGSAPRELTRSHTSMSPQMMKEFKNHPISRSAEQVSIVRHCRSRLITSRSNSTRGPKVRKISNIFRMKSKEKSPKILRECSYVPD